MRIRFFAAALLTAGLAGPALAAPTVQVAGGNTSVELSDALVDALGTLGVRVGPIRPARLDDGRARFPIPGGALDLETARGDVFHVGGLLLVAGGTGVELLDFIIDTTGSTPVLTGLVSVDGDLVGRVPLFDLGLTSAPELGRRGRLEIRGVDVTLTAAAAQALNDIFGVSAFVEGFEIGVARLKTRVRLMDRDEDDDEEDDD